MAKRHRTGTDIPATPYDALFRAIFDSSDRTNALLRRCLPQTFRRLLADTPPVLEDGSFIDEALRASQSDRLFRMSLRSGRPAYVYALLEHRNFPDPGTPLQLLGCMVRIWRRHAEGRAERLRALPPIVPVVFCHGRREWNVPMSVLDTIDADGDMRPFVRSMRYVLHDLGRADLRRLSGHDGAFAGLSALAAGSEPEVAAERLASILSALPGGDMGFQTVFTYMMNALQIDLGTLESALRMAEPEQWEVRMGTMAETWQEQGRMETGSR